MKILTKREKNVEGERSDEILGRDIGVSLYFLNLEKCFGIEVGISWEPLHKIDLIKFRELYIMCDIV